MTALVECQGDLPDVEFDGCSAWRWRFPQLQRKIERAVGAERSWFPVPSDLVVSSPGSGSGSNSAGNIGTRTRSPFLLKYHLPPRMSLGVGIAVSIRVHCRISRCFRPEADVHLYKIWLESELTHFVHFGRFQDWARKQLGPGI